MLVEACQHEGARTSPIRCLPMQLAAWFPESYPEGNPRCSAWFQELSPTGVPEVRVATAQGIHGRSIQLRTRPLEPRSGHTWQSSDQVKNDLPLDEWNLFLIS